MHPFIGVQHSWPLGHHRLGSKKQIVVARSRAEAKYCVMTHPTCEFLRVCSLRRDFDISDFGPMPMHCDNKAAIFIVSNPTFHGRTKHIEVDFHFVEEAIISNHNITPYHSWAGFSQSFFPSSIFRFSEQAGLPGHDGHLCSSLRGGLLYYYVFSIAWPSLFPLSHIARVYFLFLLFTFVYKEIL